LPAPATSRTLFKGGLGRYKVHLGGYNLMPYFKGETTGELKDFPPRQKPGSFNLSEAMAKMSGNASQQSAHVQVEGRGRRASRRPRSVCAGWAEHSDARTKRRAARSKSG
jgi:hypothetical protein